MPMTDPALPDARQTQAMMDRIAHMRAASTSEALRELRTAFPGIPLAARVTALEALRPSESGSLR